MASHSSRTVSSPGDANLSRRIRANRGATLSNRVSTHHHSSRMVSPARVRTGNQGNGLRNRQP